MAKWIARKKQQPTAHNQMQTYTIEWACASREFINCAHTLDRLRSFCLYLLEAAGMLTIAATTIDYMGYKIVSRKKAHNNHTKTHTRSNKLICCTNGSNTSFLLSIAQLIRHILFCCFAIGFNVLVRIVKQFQFLLSIFLLFWFISQCCTMPISKLYHWASGNRFELWWNQLKGSYEWKTKNVWTSSKSVWWRKKNLFVFPHGFQNNTHYDDNLLVSSGMITWKMA